MSSYRSRLPSSCTMRTGGILAGASAVTGGILAGASVVTGGFGSGAGAVRVSSICLTGINGFISVFCRSAGGGCSARASMMADFGTSMRSSPDTRWIANTISSVVIAVKAAITLSEVILIGILKLPCGSHSRQIAQCSGSKFSRRLSGSNVNRASATRFPPYPCLALPRHTAPCQPYRAKPCLTSSLLKKVFRVVREQH